MNFKDHKATDIDGNEFIFTVEMQRKLHNAGLPVEPASIVDYKANFKPPSAPNPKERRERKEKPRAPRAPAFEVPDEVEVDSVTGKFIGYLEEYNSHKGFGFILAGGDKVFFHKSKMLDDLTGASAGQKLLYEVREYKGKEEAFNVEEYEDEIE